MVKYSTNARDYRYKSGSFIEANEVKTWEQIGGTERKSNMTFHSNDIQKTYLRSTNCVYWDCPSICKNSPTFGSWKSWNEKGISGS